MNALFKHLFNWISVTYLVGQIKELLHGESSHVRATVDLACHDFLYLPRSTVEVFDTENVFTEVVKFFYTSMKTDG